MKPLALILAAIVLLGCTQTPPGPAQNTTQSPTLNATPDAGVDLSEHVADAQTLFQTPGVARYSVAITFPGNLTEEQQAIAEFMQGVIQGQSSTLAWQDGTFRLDTQIGLLGETINQTTFLSANLSLWCTDDECQAAEEKDTQARLDNAREALRSPYNFLKMPQGVKAEKAWIVRAAGTSNQAGRPCDAFELELNQTYLNQTLYARPAGELENVQDAKAAVLFKGIDAPMRTCLDSKRGFVARVEMQIDLSKARNDDELKGLVMAMTQTVDEFQDQVPPAALDVPVGIDSAARPLPMGYSVLPLSANTTYADGTQYAYVGKQDGDYVIDIRNTQNASCAPTQLRLPEWTTYVCNGTAHMFLLEEKYSDEFQLTVQERFFQTEAYDAANRPVFILPKGVPLPFPDVPLIMQYDGSKAEGHLLFVGPWQGPCPTEAFYLNDKAVSYTCEGQTYAIKETESITEPGAFAVQVIKTS